MLGNSGYTHHLNFDYTSFRTNSPNAP